GSSHQVHSSAADNRSIIGVPHPVYTQQAIIKSARMMQGEDGEITDGSASGSAQGSGRSSPQLVTQNTHSHRHSPKKTKKKSNRGKKNSSSDSGSGGHLNMHGVWLHVFGDCITNIAVIISGIVIWQAEGKWRFYFDPAVSLFINTLIVWITVPLVKSASFILLNGVPGSIDLEDLRRDLKAIPNVLNVHDLHVWQLSDTKNIGSVHVLIDRPLSHVCIHNSNASSHANMLGDAEHESDHDHPNHIHEDDHDHDHHSEHQHLLKNTRSARLVTRNRRPETLVSSSSIDMDCLYMEVAAEVKRVMHRYGVHSTTIQPEFVVGQAVA
ncbi:Zinc resistance conferring protein, partial [Coemansia sp. RSA 486]